MHIQIHVQYKDMLTGLPFRHHRLSLSLPHHDVASPVICSFRSVRRKKGVGRSASEQGMSVLLL